MNVSTTILFVAFCVFKKSVETEREEKIKNMKKEEIIKEVMKHDSTVLSFPSRGPWGDSNYRGNCSGWIIAFLLWKYGLNSMSEIFAGSGTGYDVCKDFGIPYTGIDLNPTPMRDGIISMDILDDNIPLPDGFYNSELIFAHPPYPSINQVRYANNMWQDTSGQNLSTKDIQNMSWESGMKAVNHAIMRGYTAMQPGAYEAVLVGDVRRSGTFRSMMNELITPGELVQVIIKMQHNTVSGRQRYDNPKSFVPLAHEYLVVFKKASGYELAFVLPKEYRLDIRDSKSATWKDVVAAALNKLKGKATLTEIYKQIDGHKKCASNAHWKEKVRQVLQNYDTFQSQERGVWSMVA